MDHERDQDFVSLDIAARRAGVPARWLKSQAEAGLVPCLVVGRRRLFHLASLKRFLLDACLERNGADGRNRGRAKK